VDVATAISLYHCACTAYLLSLQVGPCILLAFPPQADAGFKTTAATPPSMFHKAIAINLHLCAFVLLVDLQACNSWLLLLEQFFVSSDIKLPAAHMVITAIPTPIIKGLCCIKSALLCYWLYYCCCQNCQLICLHLQMTILYSPILLAVPPLQLLLATLCQYWFQVHWRLLVLALLQIADAMATNDCPLFDFPLLLFHLLQPNFLTTACCFLISWQWAWQ